jgi:PAS domain S-box-containing protein
MKRNNHDSVVKEVKSIMEGILGHRADDPAEIRRLITRAIKLLESSEKKHKGTREHISGRDRQLSVVHSELEKERQRYQELFEYAPDAYLVTDAMGTIQEANHTASALLNVPIESLIGKPLILYVTEKKKKDFNDLILQLSKANSLTNLQMQLQPKIGAPFQSLINVAVFPDHAGEAVELRWIIRDISVQLEMDRHLREKTRSFDEKVHELDRLYTILQITSNLRISFDQVMVKTAELICESGDSPAFIGARIVVSGKEYRSRNFFETEPSYEIDIVVEGNPVGCLEVMPLKDKPEISQSFPSSGQKPFLAAVAEQLALFIQRKQMEREARFMSARLLDAQELERARFAREVHDGIGSRLTALKFAIEDRLDKADETFPATGLSLEHIAEMIKDIMAETRRISMQLRPGMLDQLGLLPALSWLGRQIQELHNDIEIKTCFEVEEAQIPEELKTPLFRIAEEAMNNLAKHSQAEHVLMSLKKVEGNLEISITDDGMGFDMSDPALLSGHGLASMQDRARLSEGVLQIGPIIGAGTTIVGTWPLPQD